METQIDNNDNDDDDTPMYPESERAVRRQERGAQGAGFFSCFFNVLYNINLASAVFARSHTHTKSPEPTHLVQSIFMSTPLPLLKTGQGPFRTVRWYPTITWIAAQVLLTFSPCTGCLAID